MQAIGQRLAEARKRLGLTLEEVERSTRIRAHLLQILERGELDEIPSRAQARGFLHNYADYLGLNADEILDQYKEALGSQTKGWPRKRAFHEAPTRPSVHVRSRRPTWLSVDLFVAAAITIAILGVIAWGVGRVVTAMRERTLAAQGNSSFLIPTFTPTASPQATAGDELERTGTPEAILVAPAAVEATPTPTLALAFDGVSSAAIDLRILVEKRSWLLVVVDGEEQERRRAVPGEILEYQGEDLIEVITGNGAGLRVFYNGQDQGHLGEIREVVVRLWTPEGAITPTPSVTPTPAPATETQVPASEGG